MSKSKSDKLNALLYAKANAAGKAAAQACSVVPMIVGEAKGLLGGGINFAQPVYYVADGVCGFAWIKISGNSSFGKWAKKQLIARPGYPNGLQISVSEYGQSMQLKEAYAYAFAEVLREAGIEAYAQSRLD